MLRIHFLNVDNGDCIILEHERDGRRSFGLVDCNRTPARQSPARDKLVELGAESLEFVCITHPDKDHFSGIFDVLTHFDGRIGQFLTFPLGSILTDREKLKRYLRQIAAIAMRGDDDLITQKHLEFMQIIRFAYERFYPRDQWIEVAGDYDRLGIDGFAGVEFFGIMPPRRVTGAFIETMLGQDPIETLNNNTISSAIYLRYAGRAIILAGDAVDDNWNWHRRFRARAGNVTINSDIVKLPHHGSRYDNSPQTLGEFFAWQADGVAVISANGRSHPDFEIFPILDELGAKRYCTNVCNPSDRQVKRLMQDADLDRRLQDFINIYADPVVETPSPCKGDICIAIREDGTVTETFQYNTLCGCSRLAELIPNVIDAQLA